jgi:fermentation-respiration switch protein FrsA (DUF1100 family)
MAVITAARVSPTPLLMLVAEQDTIAPTDLALHYFEAAHEPKKLILMPNGHFEPYERQFDLSGPPARDWFLKYLVSNP